MYVLILDNTTVLSFYHCKYFGMFSPPKEKMWDKYCKLAKQ